MKTHDFFYALPEELIAQIPPEPRDGSRMMICDRQNAAFRHGRFLDLPQYLRPGDAVVINHTKVIPARLIGQKEDSGLACEVLLLKRISQDSWEALVRPGRRLKSGSRLSFGDGLLKAVVESSTDFGGRMVRFFYEGVFEEVLDRLGHDPDLAGMAVIITSARTLEREPRPLDGEFRLLPPTGFTLSQVLRLVEGALDALRLPGPEDRAIGEAQPEEHPG